jgi:radical SAM-linked protein
LSSIRTKFVRGEEVKYISHLDLMKVFERALRRSGIPIAYSQGFNPHPHMVFGLPLSVGVTSEAEYADFELSEAINPEDFMERLNKELPSGLKIVCAKEKIVKSNIMATIIRAEYELLVSSGEKPGIDNIKEAIREFTQRETIVVSKEGKSSVKQVDIKPMIFELDIKFFEKHDSEIITKTENSNKDICLNPWMVNYFEKIKRIAPGDLSYKIDNMFCLFAKLNAGSKANLKPDLLVSAINMVTNMGLKLVKVHRTGLLVEKGGSVLEPLDEKALL